jgi:hypothetical protein
MVPIDKKTTKNKLEESIACRWRGFGGKSTATFETPACMVYPER